MKVEVRQRIGIRPVGAVSAAAASKRPGSPNFSVVEAYQDSCFESPTRFFTVAPEHPKLGKWATPSTLKYTQAPQTAALVVANCCLDEAAASAATLRSRQPQTACSSPVASRGCHDKGGGRGGGGGGRVDPSSPTRPADSGAGGSGGGGGGRGSGGGGDGKYCYDKGPRHKMVGSNKTSVVGDGGGGGGGGGAAAVREDGKRPVSPAGALRWGSESPPPSPHWGRREAPRINTPVSGRVAPLHQRGFQASFRPSSPTLRGSFDNLQKRHNKMSTSCTAMHFPQNCTWLPTVQREETESDTTQHHNHHHDHHHQPAREGFPVLGVEEVGVDLKTVALRSEYEAEEEVDPDVRYRVRFTDPSRGPSTEGDTTLLSPPVHAVVLPSASSTPAPRPDVYTSPLQPKIRQRVGDSSRGERAPAPLAAAAAAATDEATRDEALVDQWVSSEVDPFLSAVRRELLRDRPVDISAYVSNFCNVWRGGGNT